MGGRGLIEMQGLEQRFFWVGGRQGGGVGCGLGGLCGWGYVEGVGGGFVVGGIVIGVEFRRLEMLCFGINGVGGGGDRVGIVVVEVSYA